MQHVRTGLVTALTVALLITPSWPLVGALVVVGALSALDFITQRAALLDANARASVEKAAKAASAFDERVERLETQMRFLNAPRGANR